MLLERKSAAITTGIGLDISYIYYALTDFYISSTVKHIIISYGMLDFLFLNPYISYSARMLY